MKQFSCTAICVAALAVAACQTAGHDPMSVATLDHVIVGVSDLEQGVAAFTAATGVVPVRGGQHPGRAIHRGETVVLELAALLGRMDARVLVRPRGTGLALAEDADRSELAIDHARGGVREVAVDQVVAPGPLRVHAEDDPVGERLGASRRRGRAQGR